MIKRITGKTISFESQANYLDITRIDLKIDGHSASLFDMLELMYSVYHCDDSSITLYYENSNSTPVSFSDVLTWIL